MGEYSHTRCAAISHGASAALGRGRDHVGGPAVGEHVGFGTLAVLPTIAVLVAYQVIRRAGNFAFARPTREVLFTVVPREDKYKAKSFIDTVIYRLGDQVGAWSYAGLGLLGLALPGIAVAAVPLSFIWLINAVWLGRKQNFLEIRQAAEPEASKLAD